jgi:hypothetical protein
MEPEGSLGAGIKLTTEPDESTPCPPIMFYDTRIHFMGYECHTFIFNGRNILRELLFTIRIST